MSDIKKDAPIMLLKPTAHLTLHHYPSAPNHVYYAGRGIRHTDFRLCPQCYGINLDMIVTLRQGIMSRQDEWYVLIPRFENKRFPDQNDFSAMLYIAHDDVGRAKCFDCQQEVAPIRTYDLLLRIAHHLSRKTEGPSDQITPVALGIVIETLNFLSERLNFRDG